MPRTVLGACVAGVGLLLAGFAVWGLWQEAPMFWDPCQEWGIRSGGSHAIRPGDPCQRWSGTSETKAQAVLRLALVQGVILLAGGLAVAAGWRAAAGPALAAGLLMAGEGVVLFLGISAAFLPAVASAVLFLVAAARWRRRYERATP
jgi:hypothetical protein